jgi:hypothetical protein
MERSHLCWPLVRRPRRIRTERKNYRRVLRRRVQRGHHVTHVGSCILLRAAPPGQFSSGTFGCRRHPHRGRYRVEVACSRRIARPVLRPLPPEPLPRLPVFRPRRAEDVEDLRALGAGAHGVGCVAGGAPEVALLDRDLFVALDADGGAVEEDAPLLLGVMVQLALRVRRRCASRGPARARAGGRPTGRRDCGTRPSGTRAIASAAAMDGDPCAGRGALKAPRAHGGGRARPPSPEGRAESRSDRGGDGSGVRRALPQTRSPGTLGGASGFPARAEPSSAPSPPGRLCRLDLPSGEAGQGPRGIARRCLKLKVCRRSKGVGARDGGA